MSSKRENERIAPDNAHELLQVDPELLAQYIGRELTSDPKHPIWGDQRFLQWLAAEAREQYERTHRMTDAEFCRRGEEFMARAQARKLRVACSREAPVVQSARDEVQGESLSAVGERPVPLLELGIAAGVGRDLWDQVVDTTVDLPPDVPPGRYIAMPIVGESMAPLMHTGDTVLVRLETNVKRDTVIVARHPDDGYVCKRVSRIRRKTIELSSLEPGRPIITIPRDPANLVGTVILVWCTHRGRASG